MRTFKQGDVLLEKMEFLSSKVALQSSVDGRVLLAYGEDSGHPHAVSAENAQLYTNGQEKYLLTEMGARIVDEEHASITLEPGVYRIIQKRECAAS